MKNKKNILIILLSLLIVLAFCLPTLAIEDMEENTQNNVLVYGVKNNGVYTQDSMFALDLQAENEISWAIVTLSTSPEYAVGEVWFAQMFPKNNNNNITVFFTLNGKNLYKSDGVKIQRYGEKKLPEGKYYLHITVYSEGCGYSKMIGEFEIKQVINIQQRFSKKIVAMIILLNVAFTIAVLYTFLKVGSEPTSLIVAWFSFTTVELWSLSNITKTKIQLPKDGDQENGSL